MRISEVRGAWASTRCKDSVTGSEGAASFFALNTKTIDSIHPRARLNGSERHIRSDVLYECEDVDTGYRILMNWCVHEKEMSGRTVHRWLSDNLYMGDSTEH